MRGNSGDRVALVCVSKTKFVNPCETGGVGGIALPSITVHLNGMLTKRVFI